ncbi:MAG TPA: class II aldolase/adducin family protein, partial [Thermoanaerobaculia bacterium]
HGSVAVGATLKQVVYRAIYAEVNARLQSEALRLGTITYLNDAEAANAARANDSVIDRPWGLWKARVKQRG